MIIGYSDRLLGRRFNSKYLVYSEYTSTEIFCCEASVEKIITILGLLPACGIGKLIVFMRETLEELFLIRSANIKLDWKMTWVDFTKSCFLKQDVLRFETDEFIRRYLTTNARRREVDRFLEVLRELREIKVPDWKCRIRCHDFFELLGWYIARKKGKGGNKYRNPEVIRSMVVLASTNLVRTIAQEPFNRIYNTYTDLIV